jgi:ubiquitin-protein ligase
VFQSLAIQELLDDPNPKSPANWKAGDQFTTKRKDYDRAIRAQAAKFTPST